jgi:bla regulator protein blaR1
VIKRGATAAFLFPLLLIGQPPAFEVASVKPTRPDDLRGSTYGFNPGGLEVTNGTLKGLIQMAYDVPAFQISGGPGWINSERYSISAKTEAASQDIDRQKRIAETRQRLQTLLADRFRLRVHRETKEIPEYTLVIAKNGAKLTEAAQAPERRGEGIRAGCGQMTGTRATMANLAFALTRQMGRPVLDRTGLEGKYDFQVDWAPDGACAGPPGGAGTDMPPAPSDGPSIFTALQERLGLKLEATKGPVEVVVIDRVERPAEN